LVAVTVAMLDEDRVGSKVELMVLHSGYFEVGMKECLKDHQSDKMLVEGLVEVKVEAMELHWVL
jgi:phage replication-related protein YjqB (UPF0714/DUF867 family)